MVPPASCKICSASSLSEREYWIDTGTSEEFYGAVYYCCICFEEMARDAGLLSRKDSDRIKEKYDYALERIRELKASIAAISNIGIDIGAISRFIKNHPDAVEPDEEGLGELVERAATIVEQTSKPRSDDVSSSKPKRLEI